MNHRTIHIVGAGLAGSEAAWQAAEAGARVVLHEMRPQVSTFAHQTGNFAELVCSNSFRSDELHNAIGLLHEEMRRCGSLILRMADIHKVPAGGALAVDRDGFSAAVTDAVRSHPNIAIESGEITTLPTHDDALWILATGPLTSQTLTESILRHTGEEYLAFFDAIAPSSAAIRCIWIFAGSSHAMTRAAARTISTARWTGNNTTPLSTH